MTASAGGRELSQRLAKIETAISRRKTIEFTYYTMERDETEKRKVDPYHLVFRGGQFYLIGHSHERDAVRVFRLSRIRGKVSYATQGRARLLPARGLRPPRLRPAAPTGRWARSRGRRRSSSASGSPGWSSATSASYGELRAGDEGRRRARQGPDLRDRLRLGARADRLGAALAPERRAARARTSCARRPRAARTCCASATRTASSRPKTVDRPLRRGAAPRPLQRPRRGGDPARALRPPRHPRRDADRLGQARRAAAGRPTCASGSS